MNLIFTIIKMSPHAPSICRIIMRHSVTLSKHHQNSFPAILLQGYTVANDPFPPYRLFRVLTLSLLDLGCDSISGGPQAASISTS